MSIRDQGLQHWPSQIEKVKQFHSQIMVRHGVMLVGPTGGGKTVSRNILQRALVLLPTLSMDDLDIGARKQSVFVVSLYLILLYSINSGNSEEEPIITNLQNKLKLSCG